MENRKSVKYTRISEWPRGEQPREKLSRHGADSLSDAELIAILLRSGCRDKSAVDLARQILEEQGGLPELGRMSVASLRRIRGVGEAKAVTVAAAFQLGSRFVESDHYSRPLKIRGSLDVFRAFAPGMRLLNHEVFRVLLLSSSNMLIRDVLISRGHLNASVVHAREIFKAAIDHLAAAVILMHNHPSGNPQASDQDMDMTRRIVEGGRIIGIPVLDHIIIADKEYFSFADKGLI